jgi:hypothetical protein
MMKEQRQHSFVEEFSATSIYFEDTFGETPIERQEPASELGVEVKETVLSCQTPGQHLFYLRFSQPNGSMGVVMFYP